MKLGWDLRTGFERKYTAWKSPDDPSPGDVSRVMKLYSYPEIYMMKGTQKLLRYGPWNGEYFSGMPDLLNNTIFDLSYVSNEDEIYYTYTLVNDSVLSRTVTNQSATIDRYVWQEVEKIWKIYRSYPKEFCDKYDSCGPNGLCVRTQSQSCTCLEGFSPKSQQNWISSDWSGGCVRNKALNCSHDVFVKYEGLKVPATTNTLLNKSLGLKECEVKCLNNCSCMAYTNSDIRNGGSGCVLWFGDLIDMKQFETGGQDLYIRMNASEAGNSHQLLSSHFICNFVLKAQKSYSDFRIDYFVFIVNSNSQEPVPSKEPGNNNNRRTIVASTVAAVSGFLILLITCIICRLHRNNAGK